MKSALLGGAVLAAASLVWGCSSGRRKAEVKAETLAREAYAHAVAVDAGAGRMLPVASRTDVLFEEGFSNLSYDPPQDFRNSGFRWMGQRGHIRVRSHGDRPMRLKTFGWLHEKVIRAKGVVTIYVDGIRIADTGAVEKETWVLETVIPTDLLRGKEWLDVIITASAVSFHWAEPPALAVVALNSFEWTEIP